MRSSGLVWCVGVGIAWGLGVGCGERSGRPDDDDDDDAGVDGGLDADDAGAGDDDDDVAPTPGDFIPPAGTVADQGGTPPPGLDQSATWIGAERPGTPAGEAWWAGWTTMDGQDDCPDGNDEVVVDANVTEDTTWTADHCYVLATEVYVVGDEDRRTTLRIEAGTHVEGEDGEARLVITPTARIDAQGRPDAPIVFTSREAPGRRSSGDWGGVVLLGRAPINAPDGEASYERLDDAALSSFGGDEPTHDCGTLRYVRAEFTGGLGCGGCEAPAFTFAGCGTGTRADHLQALAGDDDAVAIFGGGFALTHVVLVGHADDGLDVDFGWSGSVQFLLDWNFAGQRSNEWENSFDDRDAAPRTRPVVWNATYVGMDGPGRECFRLREGTQAEIHNVICQDFVADQCVEVQHVETGLQLVTSDVVVRDSLFNGCGTPFRFRHADSCFEDPCSQGLGPATCDGDPEDPTCSLSEELVPPFADPEYGNIIDAPEARVSVPPTPPW